MTSAWSDANDTDRNIAWTREFFDAMQPFLAKAAYVNYLGGDEGTAGLSAAYSTAKLERLTVVKTKYDPKNLFRMNQNIVPASAGDAATDRQT